MKIGDLVYINFNKKEKYDNIEEIGHIYQNMTGVIIDIDYSSCTIELSLRDKEKVKKYDERTGQNWVVTPRIPHKFLFLKKSLLKNE
jgi:predicted RNA-binding protein with RPS1 domain